MEKENYNSIFNEWEESFIKKIKSETGSRKIDFDLFDAIKRSKNIRTPFDSCMIQYFNFINSNPLNENDYFKYLDSYTKGKELYLKFFRHDVNKLKAYYKKADKEDYQPFNIENYNRYVLFMMLKLKGLYRMEYDAIFRVIQKEGREYNPLTSIPSVLRGELPIKVKEYDIKRAYPTFIDNQLKIERREDVYSLIDKRRFNMLLNMHTGIKNASIDVLRHELKPVYGNKVNEVITDSRFNTKGGLFKELVLLEEKAIVDFVNANNLKNYVRLHDGVFVLANIKCSKLNIEPVEFAIKECIKPKVINDTKIFYQFNQLGKLITSPKQYADFLETEKFIRVTEQDNDKVTIFKDSNNVVAPINHKTDVVPFLKNNINEFNTDEVENRIAREATNTIYGAFLLLEPKPLLYYTDSKDSFGLPFKNGFFKYELGNEELVQTDYENVNGFFAPHNTQGKEFDYNLMDESIFETFLKMACTGKDPRTQKLTDEDLKTFDSFRYMIGYLCHNFKDSSFSPAIILSDEGANDLNRNGGRGKTLITKAIAHVQKTLIKGGDEFKPNYIHNFADLTKDVNVYILDDVPAGFNYDAMYTNILGEISCQRKGKAAQNISFKEAPKFLITTNWAVRFDENSTSTNRRFVEFKLTDFFNINRTPKKEFNQTFFEDWTTEEWNKFYSFIYRCVADYLVNGLIPIEYDKEYDNFIAYFNNDSVLDEFERVFNIVKTYKRGFNVSDFLAAYKDPMNPLKYEKYFHNNNVKGLIQVYLKYKQLPFEYSQMNRKWIAVNVEVVKNIKF
ncbi:hypothetical protein I2486_16110 [Cellulophaga sp. E16_2]|uniref:hypothetical protein n=1 Tax=Cellulophaga sp. E16_2 TaxID=2789297 RepID=UPI001A91E681|nr:hypothetical protein [Cellulophaga sp. E16_2]MBO0592929.1 hypothetical protein [Cellulophaga sp. E16_2]